MHGNYNYEWLEGSILHTKGTFATVVCFTLMVHFKCFI